MKSEIYTSCSDFSHIDWVSTIEKPEAKSSQFQLTQEIPLRFLFKRKERGFLILKYQSSFHTIDLCKLLSRQKSRQYSLQIDGGLNYSYKV